jgi:uroporphyrinogen decarboxylase
LNKIERVRTALAGGDVDRPPFSFWYHFGLQHASGRRHAETEIEFYRAYGLDFVKVMSDYPYPRPPGVDVVALDHWGRVEAVRHDDSCWEEQLTALSIINDEIGDEALFIETVFSPWTTARRMTHSEGLRRAMEACPELLLQAMDAIATSLASYAREAVSRGAAGIFYSVGAASQDVMAADEYLRWGLPFDLKVLEAVKDAEFNVLHVHGAGIYFDDVLQLPAGAINWSHQTTAPALADGKSRWGKTVMGGINETTASRVSTHEIEQQVEEALLEVGLKSVIITPGCSIPTDTPVRNLHAIREAVGRSGRH